MLIGVDIDNTIADTNHELIKRFGIKMESYPDPAVPVDFFKTKNCLKLLARTKAFPVSAQILTAISRSGGQLVYVTSRPLITNFITHRWLELNGYPFGPVVYTTSDKKAEIACTNSFYAFFEDDPLVAQLLLRSGVLVFLKDWPYNRDITASKLFRFKKWHEIEKLLVSAAISNIHKQQ
ncbi:hypothetical protein [Desulfoscipio geothermicus]|uniref:Uncharacterized protein, HAD superfamily n=1 Tax=Desulfoscipio geothermicus DSM 3669 TaxID=1121426 RepID=A0A1I6E4I8_9FIRM|nr:hypothetical protein [Desulfoscipio geothermicus]SFR12557.1 Uncharacterized protein, HAD superfamily [Desulfoscipio geothermicus DSM 3669]